MKQTLIAGALALACVMSSAALAGEACFYVDSGIRDDNGRAVMQRVCVSDDRPAPPMRLERAR